MTDEELQERRTKIEARIAAHGVGPSVMEKLRAFNDGVFTKKEGSGSGSGSGEKKRKVRK